MLKDWLDHIIKDPIRKEVLNLLNADKEEVNRMTANIIKTLQEEKSQAREMGREEGREAGKLEAAKALLDILEDEVIAKRLELPLEDVKKLRK